MRSPLHLLLLALLPLTKAEPAASKSPSDASITQIRAFIERFGTDRAALDRRYPISFSANTEKRFSEFYAGEADALKGIEFSALDQDGKIDYLLIKNEIEAESKKLEQRRLKQQELAGFLPFLSTISTLEEQRLARGAAAPEDAAKTLTKLSSEIKEKLQEAEKLDGAKKNAFTNRVLWNRAARLLPEVSSTLKRWHDYYSGYDPLFSWWADEPYEKVRQGLEKYGEQLRKAVKGKEADDDPVIGDPIGREALLAELRTEWIPYTPEELIGIAEKEFAWCEAEFKKASRELGFGDDWHKAIEAVSAKHAPPGGQPQIIRDLAEEATRFVEEHDLVTVPPLAKEIWRMEMMTPERQRVNPFFTGGEILSVSYPTAGMSTEEKLMSMRGNNVHFSRATVQHEVIPGHHLQLFMAARHRTHRQMFRTPFLIEGWALYWEMLLWDLSFPRNAEDRIGMLFWRSHRCARIIFSLRFHLGTMTPQEAIDFLVDRVGHERKNATGEVRRSFAGEYSPLYQAAYMLGGLQIRALHRELVNSGKLSNRAFHDAVLRENEIPIDMIRASLENLPLTPDHPPSWRFYESRP